jgi:hypothetical protein
MYLPQKTGDGKSDGTFQHFVALLNWISRVLDRFLIAV